MAEEKLPNTEHDETARRRAAAHRHTPVPRAADAGRRAAGQPTGDGSGRPTRRLRSDDGSSAGTNNPRTRRRPAAAAGAAGAGAQKRVRRDGAAHAGAGAGAGATAAPDQDERTRRGLSGKLDALRGKGLRAAVGIGAGASGDDAGTGRSGRPKKPKKPRRPNPIARIANRWFDRVMGAVKDGGLSNQEAEYAAHRTTRDFVWNSIGAGAWGVVFPIITMVSTQLVGAEQAGMVSMAFTIGLLLMFVANFGVRTYQISDIDEAHSFNDYQINRWITCAIMILIGVAYCSFRGYGADMFNICMGIFVYKMIDGLADVYEGRLQQVDKLYLAGVSQAFRSVLALVAFSVALFITRNAAIASFAMAVVAALTFVVITYPLTLLETPRSRRASARSIGILFKNTAPLFIGVFLFNLIDSMPKFVMEGTLSYDNQLYYNALFFPAQFILMTAQLVYKPLLVRMAGVWQDTSKRRQFDMILVGILLFCVALTAGVLVLMSWVGVPLLGLLYGLDFEPMRNLLYVMLVAGGVTAAIDFLYQVITVMRRQRDVTALYVVTFGFSLLIPILLISFTQLPGAVLSYLIVMVILFVLLVWEYLRIRRDLAQGHKVYREPKMPERKSAPVEGRYAHASQGALGDDGALEAEITYVDAQGAELENAAAESGEAYEGELSHTPRPSEVRAERLRREEVMNRRVRNRRS